jgi:hypothetical protein
MPAACDDAVGTGYTGGTSGQVMTPEATPPDDPLDADDPKAETEVSVAHAAARAADLGLSEELDYTCGDDGATAHVVLYGSGELAAVVIPGHSHVPLYVDCSPTRVGPECVDGAFTALINTLDDTATFTLAGGDAPLVCTALQPEFPPETE